MFVNVELHLAVEHVRAHDVLSVAGHPEKVMYVTVLHNGRRLHTVSGNHLTLSKGRMMTVLRRMPVEGDALGTTSDDQVVPPLSERS
ncbi:hypothetical protein ACGFX7_24235 [Streptomyces harbinensis]|uniref:hypothetical protein n=1 Tax=Streptomyces harbinensis TaxID=1176198 RepID=UPI00372420AE